MFRWLRLRFINFSHNNWILDLVKFNSSEIRSYMPAGSDLHGSWVQCRSHHWSVGLAMIQMLRKELFTENVSISKRIPMHSMKQTKKPEINNWKKKWNAILHVTTFYSERQKGTETWNCYFSFYNLIKIRISFSIVYYFCDIWI